MTDNIALEAAVLTAIFFFAGTVVEVPGVQSSLRDL